MGTPDTVYTNCPKCNAGLDFQSKGGECSLSYYSLETAPDDVMSDVNRHAPIECKCGSKWVVIVSGLTGRRLIEVK